MIKNPEKFQAAQEGDTFFATRYGKYYYVIYSGVKHFMGQNLYSLIVFNNGKLVLETVASNLTLTELTQYIKTAETEFFYVGNNLIQLTVEVKKEIKPLNEAAKNLLARWDDIAEVLNIDYSTGGAFKDYFETLRESLEAYENQERG